MFRERGRKMERAREMGREGERERERERGGKGRVIYTICALFATLFSEKGGSEETNSGVETVKIQKKKKQKNNRIGKRT